MIETLFLNFQLLLNLDCQNLAMLGFDNCLIAENESSLLEMKVHQQFFTSLWNLFPGTRNYYSEYHKYETKVTIQYLHV